MPPPFFVRISTQLARDGIGNIPAVFAVIPRHGWPLGLVLCPSRSGGAPWGGMVAFGFGFWVWHRRPRQPPRPAEGNKSYAIAASGAASGVSAESAASTVSVAAINIAISGASMQ